MDIGDQWNLSEPQSPETSSDTSLLTDTAQFIQKSGEASKDPAQTNENESEHRNLWMEFETPGIPNSPPKPVSAPGGIPAEDRLREWASLLTGDEGIKGSPDALAQKRFLEWLTRSSNSVVENLSGFPEMFQTTRFWSELKSIEIPVRFLKTVLENLRSKTLSFSEAVDFIGRNFGWDQERLLKWKQGLENLEGLKRWVPVLTQEYEYLAAALPLGNEKLDGVRHSLLMCIEEPHSFLESKARNGFDSRFLEYKKSYINSYFLLHEDVLHVMGGLKRDEVKIDGQALRNLEMLSGLQHADQSYLNRVKLLAKWIQHNQCNLPLHQILELYPRCYCNFNPVSPQQPASSAAQINTIIQEGLEQFRVILRKCGYLILLQIKAQPADDETLRQITAVLGDGPMIPLKPQSIKILNRIIAGHPNEFLSEFRKAQWGQPSKSPNS
jgi:hypothetical protein